MSQEIESVKPILTVIDDDGDLIINSTGLRGKAMVQAVLALASNARKISVISDGEMKVMKRSVAVENGSSLTQPPTKAAREHAAATAVAQSLTAGPDIQDQFAADLEAGVTGEIATGEVPAPAQSAPQKRRQPRIFQDAAAPPAPELAELEMDRLLAESAQAEQDAARVVEDQRFQRQQAVQSGDQSALSPEEAEAARAPRKRERNLAITGSPCGNCRGGGQSIRIDSTGSPILDEHGRAMSGVCQVCGGSGQVKSWGRGRR
jgi:hypothetical protein